MTPVSSDVNFNYQSYFNCQERLTGLQNKVRDFELKMGLDDQVTLAISCFNKSPAAIQGKNVIKLPAWFLFNYEDIPPRLRVRDVDDPRLIDQNFLNDAADWMNRRIREMGISTISGPVNVGCLQVFLKLLRDPALYEKCKDFSIGHELGHLGYSQSCRGEFNLHQGMDAAAIGGILAGLLVFFLATALLPLVHVTITVGVTCLGCAISIGGIVSWLNKPERSHTLNVVEEEKKADLDAVKMLGDASGGIYLFDTFVRHNLLLRNRNPVSSVGIDGQGNNLNDKNHPPLSERLSYLRRWQSAQ